MKSIHPLTKYGSMKKIIVTRKLSYISHISRHQCRRHQANYRKTINRMPPELPLAVDDGASSFRPRYDFEEQMTYFPGLVIDADLIKKQYFE